MGIRHLALRFTASVAGLAAMIALALVYELEPGSYYRILQFVGNRPLTYPFLDFQAVLSAVDCWQHGIDVYFDNTCVRDIFNRFTYSPVWLRFAFLPGEEWTNPLGLCLAISFFLALAVLPPPRSTKELLLRLIATLSPVTTFAVERANIDLLMFVMATTAGVLLLGPLSRRVVAYAIIVVAGLLKIYPLVLMLLTLRERPRAFFWVNGAAATVVLATFLYLHADFMKMVPNIPVGFEFSDYFGAHLLPDLIVLTAGIGTHPRLALLVKVLMPAALCLAIVGWFLRTVGWRDFRIALARLPKPEKVFLLIGAALIGGCFFAGSSVGYRGIHLLLTLPGLFALARIEGHQRVRRVAAHGCVLVVALTWVGFFTWHGPFRQILESWIGGSFWILSQIAWWPVATLFIAILIGCCANWFETVPEWRRLLRRVEVGQALIPRPGAWHD
jgi:hypothetical protein